VRRTLGLWKLMFVKPGPVVSFDEPTGELLRGQYLVEGPGHCGECHTPRNALGGLDYRKWLAGGPNPDGPGTIPNITDDPGGLADWSEDDIAGYLKSGFGRYGRCDRKPGQAARQRPRRDRGLSESRDGNSCGQVARD